MIQKRPAFFCTLQSRAFNQRKEMIKNKILTHLIEHVEIENGIKATFPNRPDFLNTLKAFIKLENQCCSFLDFTLTESPDRPLLILEVTGPDSSVNELISEVLS